MTTLKDMLTPIHEAHAKWVAPLAAQLAALDEDDGRDPAWKAKARAAIRKEYSRLHQQVSADVADIMATVRMSVEAQLGASTIGSAADETARLADLQEVPLVAARVNGAVQAGNILVPEGARALELGNLRRAEVYCRAAESHGASVQVKGLRDSIEAWRDKSDPARVKAHAELAEAEAATEAFNVALAVEAHGLGVGPGGVGTGLEAAARSSIAAKSAAFRQSEATGTPYVNPIPPEPEKPNAPIPTPNYPSWVPGDGAK